MTDGVATGLEAEHPPPSTTLVIFGASGDLSTRKLLPALYNLFAEGLLPEDLRIIGVSRDEDPQAFHRHAHDSVSAHSRTGFDEQTWQRLDARLEKLTGEFDDPGLFTALAEALAKRGGESGPAQYIFYLAVAPKFFGPIARSLARVGLGRGCELPARLVVEKPFGVDYASAANLNRELLSAFDEKQIYRIDHYLGKETVQNIQILRFANGIFEPLWNRNYIEQVQITMAEGLGIEGRAGYYESAGALRDVIQNHLMQLMALVAMEPPARFKATEIRDEKVKLLRSVRVYTEAEVPDFTARGQYAAGRIGDELVPGYLDEDGVAPDSRTETFAAIRLEIDNWRWAGVPFYIRTGKRLPRQLTEIAIRFRRPPHLALGKLDDGADVEQNELVLSVQPEEGASLRLMAKVPGQGMNVRQVEMDFDYGSSFTSASPEAYERLLLDVFRGDATLFTRADEVEAEWSIIDPVLHAWAAGPAPEPYVAGSQGPGTAAELLAVRGRSWRRI